MVKISTLNNSKYNYSREAEIIEGNAATGEQYSLKRVIYSEVPITYEIAKRYLDEMEEQIKQLRAENPYQVISAVSYENEGGNQVIKFTPTTELIFPDRVPIFDEEGNQIVGEENIRAEVKRREAQWVEWERTGQLKESIEIHHADDGKMVRIKFRAAPIRRHPNETRAFDDWLSGLPRKGELEEIKDESENSSNIPDTSSPKTNSNQPQSNNNNNNEKSKTHTNRERERERERAKIPTINNRKTNYNSLSMI